MFQLGAGADTLTFSDRLTGSKIEAGADADSLYFAAALDGSTILGEAGADTIQFAGAVSGAFGLDAGADADSLYFGANVADGAVTLIGGAGNDTMGFAAAATGVITGGTGNDSITFGTAGTSTSLTYVFQEATLGAGDTLSFTSVGATSTNALVTVQMDDGLTGTNISITKEFNGTGTLIKRNDAAGNEIVMGFIDTVKLTVSSLTKLPTQLRPSDLCSLVNGARASALLFLVWFYVA